MVAQVRAPLYEEKVVDYVLELVTITNETVNRETLFADDDAPAPPSGTGQEDPEVHARPRLKVRSTRAAGLAARAQASNMSLRAPIPGVRRERPPCSTPLKDTPTSSRW